MVHDLAESRNAISGIEQYYCIIYKAGSNIRRKLPLHAGAPEGIELVMPSNC